MRPHRRPGKLLVLAGAAAIGLSIVYGASNWSEIRPKLSYYKQRLLELHPAFRGALEEIAAHVKSKHHPSESERLDFIRQWVFQNSVHIEDDEWKQYASRTHVVVPRLWRAYSRGESRPHLSCGPRAYAMKAILDKLGVKSRIIDALSVSTSGVEASHTFLEVWNRDTGAWEIQDPDLNISYHRVKSRARASVHQLVTGNLEEFEPVGRGESLGWGSGSQLKRFFNIVVYRLHYEGERSKVIINLKRLDPGLDFAGIARGLKAPYYNPIILDSDHVRI